MGVCGETEKPSKKNKKGINDKNNMSGIIEGSQKEDNIKSSKKK